MECLDRRDLISSLFWRLQVLKSSLGAFLLGRQHLRVWWRDYMDKRKRRWEKSILLSHILPYYEAWEQAVMPPCMSTRRTYSDHGQAIAAAKAKDPLHFIPRLLCTTNVLLLFFCYKKLEILFLNKIQTFFMGKMKTQAVFNKYNIVALKNYVPNIFSYHHCVPYMYA